MILFGRLKLKKALQNLKLFDYDIYHFEWGLDFYRDANFAIRLKKLEKKNNMYLPWSGHENSWRYKKYR